jgi:hypothetical protein
LQGNHQQKPISTMNRSHGSSYDDYLAGSMSVSHLEEEEVEEDGGLPPYNVIIAVHIGFQLPLFSSEET